MKDLSWFLPECLGKYKMVEQTKPQMENLSLYQPDIPQKDCCGTCDFWDQKEGICEHPDGPEEKVKEDYFCELWTENGWFG